MNARRYLPSTQFATIAVALLVSGGLVYVAQYVTKPPQPASLAVAQSQTDAAQQQEDSDWQVALAQVEAQSGTSLPQAPSQDSVNQLLAGVQSSNVTDTVAKSLLINLADAKAQGLGDDEPTQDAIVSQALAQVGTTTPTVYTSADLNIVPQTKDSLHTYGNAVAQAITNYPNANASGLLLLFGYMLDYGDNKMVQPIQDSSRDYIGLAQDLSTLPVPETLAPLQLELINDLAGMGASATDMSVALTDPARGMAGLQEFESLSDTAAGVFTSVAKELNTDGILFTKDEPGTAWSGFLSTSQ